MRAIKNILIAIILFINSPVIGQQSVSFYTRYGYSGSDHTHAIGIIQQTDGNYKIISSLNRPNEKLYMIFEYDQYGNKIKYYNYPNKDLHDPIFNKSLMLDDGSILIQGYGMYSDAGIESFFNLFYDSAGNVIWEKTNFTLDRCQLFSKKDSSFIGLGIQHALKNDTFNQYSFTKINYHGKVIWNKNIQLYLDSNESFNRDWQYCLVSECNNNYYFYIPTRYKYDSSKFYLPIVITLNNNGQFIKKDTIKNIKDITWLKKINDGYLVISTTSLNQKNDFSISKLNDNFENQWHLFFH